MGYPRRPARKPGGFAVGPGPAARSAARPPRVHTLTTHVACPLVHGDGLAAAA
jgi:hypothetical protein